MIARRYDYRQKYVTPAKKLQEWEAGPSRDNVRVRFFAPTSQEARTVARMLLGIPGNDGRIFYMKKISHDIGASA